MNIQLLNYAEVFYQLAGYGKLEVPWLIEPGVSDLTKPPERSNFLVKGKAIVGSAEQSFLQLMVEGKMEPGKYVATTPCFRDEEVLDYYHQQYFLKTELINSKQINQEALDCLIADARTFFGQFIRVKVVETENNCWDIVDEEGGVELGSYGIREVEYMGKQYRWIYGTGCAEPRLSRVIGTQNEGGYHSDMTIPKSKLGTAMKIMEELHEFQDAVLNGERLLGLCELADLQGAIKHYLSDNFPGIKMADLVSMSKLTEKAFQKGVR